MFTPRHPKTKPVLAEVEKIEARLDVDALIEQAIENTEKITVKYYED